MEIKAALQFGALVAVALQENHGLTIDAYGEPIWEALYRGFDEGRMPSKLADDIAKLIRSKK